MQDSDNTHKSFHDKWHKNPDLAFSETLRVGSDTFNWILNRNGFHSSGEFSNFLSDKKRILDAGCGNGRVTALLSEFAPKESQIVGIDFSSAPVAKENLKSIPNVSISAANLMENLEFLGKYDFIYCQEVLHHTENPYLSFSNLCEILEDDGEIAIYVYKQKAPIREFVDDHVRHKIAKKEYNEAMEICRQITILGQKLSELKVEINVPRIDILEIEAGNYDIQRFFYHFFMKCFWNDNFTFEENAVINYDWYHPQLCSRHTLPEILNWFKSQDLVVTHQFVDFYGITVRGKKNL